MSAAHVWRAMNPAQKLSPHLVVSTTVDGHAAYTSIYRRCPGELP